jgi:hypothetical protein
MVRWSSGARASRESLYRGMTICTVQNTHSCTPSASAGRDLYTLSAPHQGRSARRCSDCEHQHTHTPLSSAWTWSRALKLCCSFGPLRIAGRRGLLNRHQMTGGLLASPATCTAGTSAPSQTCYRRKNVRKGWTPDNLGFMVTWKLAGEGQDARSLPFRYTVFTKDMFAAQKNGDIYLLLAYRAHISSSHYLNTHRKVKWSAYLKTFLS